MRCLLIAIIAFPSAATAVEPAPPPREVRVDAFGERLPEGAIARLGTTRLRHYGADIITFDPSGKKFITTSRFDGVRVWDAATGTLLDRWNMPREGCEALCRSADGRTAVIQGKEHLEIWDLPAGRLMQRLPLGDAPSVSAACLSNDGRWLASADNTPREHRLRLWDLRTGKNQVVGTHEGTVTQIILSRDGSRLISFSGVDLTLCVWDLETNKEVWRYPGAALRTTVHCNGRRLLINEICVTSRGFATVHDIGTGKKLSKPLPIDHADFDTALSSDGSLIAVHNYVGGSVAIYETAGHKKLHEWRVPVQAMAFHPDGNELYVIESPGVVQAFSLRTGKPLLPLAADRGHTGDIRKIAWSPDGKCIATTGTWDDRFVCVWNGNDGKLLHKLPTGQRGLAGLEFSRDGSWLWMCGHRSPLRQLDVAKGKEVKKWFVVHDDDYEKPYGRILNVKMMPDGTHARLLLLGNEERERPYVATLDLESGKIDGEHAVALPHHLLDQSHLLDNLLVVSGQVFNPATGKELPPLNNPYEETQWIDTRLSPNMWLIAGAHWKNVRGSQTIADAIIHERITGRPLFELPLGPAGKYALAPDGRHFTVAAPDGIHIWNLAARKEVRFIRGHDRFDAHSLDSFATAMAYSPDGTRIATGHFDTTVLIWEVASRTLAPRKVLTPAELERLWNELADPDPKKGLAAVFALQDRPDQALKFMRERLKPVKEPADIKQMIEQLDDDNFRLREAARKRIAEYGDAAAPALRATLKRRLSEEQQKRVGQLLADLDPRKPPRGHDLRGIRCIMVLERLKSPESRELIEEMAKGMESARVTHEAKECLVRLP